MVDPRLGWRKPEEKDPRDALMSKALEALPPVPDDSFADKTIREAYEEGYISSWRGILGVWAWIKKFFRKKPPPPNPDSPTTRLWYDPEQLNQGNTPHCVGFAGTQFLNTDPIEDHLDDAYGHTLYYSCKQIDGEPGEENGSYVHSAAKVLKARGRIGTYVWARTLEEVKQWVLTQGPVDVGTDWYENMMETDSKGFVYPTGEYGGGHSYIIVGYDRSTDVFTFQNSWGRFWGEQGYFKMHGSDFEKLFNADAEVMATTELPLAQLR